MGFDGTKPSTFPKEKLRVGQTTVDLNLGGWT